MRIPRQFVCRILRATAIIGSMAVIAGTLIITSYEFEPLGFIPAAISKLDDLDSAWRELRAFDDAAAGFEVKTSITSEQRGFCKLATLLSERQTSISSDTISMIQVKPHMYYGDEAYKIGSYVVQVVQDLVPEPVVVAWIEDVDRWILDEHLRWSLACGFPVLCGGLVLSLVPLLFPARGRDDRLRGSGIGGHIPYS